MTATISLIHDARATETTPIPLSEVTEGIKSGKWAYRVQMVRDAFAQGGKDAAADHKKRLPGVLFSGTFSARANDKLIKHSGLICADLDNLGDATESWKEQISADPHVLAAFVSPTGSGLKVVFRCDPERDHLVSFKALEHYVKTNFGLAIDPACKDVARICFVSHDPDIFTSDDAEVIPYEAPAPEPIEFRPRGLQNYGTKPGDDFDQRGDIFSILLNHGWTRKGQNGWVRPGKTGDLGATFDKVPGRFYVFTSSTEFEAQHTYRPWHVYAILEHGGDFSAAAKALAEKGFGEQVEPRQPKAEAPQKIDDLDSRRIRSAQKPVEPITRLFLAGKPIATPGNLVTLISRAKTGKTATIGAAVAAIVGAHYDRHDLDTLGFTAPHTDEAVVLIDTEQSPFDAYTCHQRAMSRAGQESDPEWLHHYALVGYSHAQLKVALPKILEKAKDEHKGIFTLIIDGVADFVASVNDEAECNTFISELRALAVLYDCPIICVIHSNEAKMSGDDGRGHLGKQLTRKAESNLLLKKTGEVTVITSEKQRKAPITEADGVAFRWSDEHGRHMLTDSIPESGKKTSGRKPMYDSSKMLSCVPGPEDKAATVGMIYRVVGQLPCTISDRSFKDYLAKWIETGEVIRSGDSKTGFFFRRAQ